MTGADMKAIRLKRGLTQAQLAAALGFGAVHGRNTVARLEKRDTIPNLHRLAMESLAKRNRNAKI